MVRYCCFGVAMLSLAANGSVRLGIIFRRSMDGGVWMASRGTEVVWNGKDNIQAKVKDAR